MQEVGNDINNEQVKVQLWDVSGSNRYQQYWETLAQVRRQVTTEMQAQHSQRVHRSDMCMARHGITTLFTWLCSAAVGPIKL